MRDRPLRSRGAAVARTLLTAIVVCVSGGAPRAQQDAVVQDLDQGGAWSPTMRARFYKEDQGSRLMPLAWLRALEQTDGTPFIASLTRYGYLPNRDLHDPVGLPIGFTHPVSERGPMVGINCAACHTREIVAGGQTYRIDGAPAVADLGAFVVDLDAAVRRALANDASFARFADLVLGADAADATARDVLKAEVGFWSVRFHTLVAAAVPSRDMWGPTRLDAFGMIFDAIAGLSLGNPPTYLLPHNIQPADAPVRYPVLWDAGRQERTQWTGFAQNGGDDRALGRSTGEAYGTFGLFRPVPTPGALGALDRDYLVQNSVVFDGLKALDDLAARIGPPSWPGPIDKTLADKGRAVFERPTEGGGCVACHGEVAGSSDGLWKTPVLDVGTDRRAWDVLERSVDTGSMAGASVPGAIGPLQRQDRATNLLGVSVAGTLVDLKAESALAHPLAALVIGALPSGSSSGSSPSPPRNAYEARVLHGIWAAAPYLHNGSVPTLSDLLKPAAQRPTQFAIGPAYDLQRVGLAAQQQAAAFVLRTTGCDKLDSGNSNCGHDYGTGLPDEDKKALLEYLKTL